MYKNSEGYSDPTAGQAMANIRREARRQEGDRTREISAVMAIIRQAAALAGMEVVGRITFRDIASGKEYR